MKTTPSRLSFLAIGLAAVVLTGCASTGSASHAGHAAPTGAAAMDMQGMCDKHRQMMAGKAPAERQAMMEQQMKSMPMPMSPEEMRGRMQAMQEQCK